MIRKVGRTKFNIFALDTETDADDYLSEACKQFRNNVLKAFNKII